MTGILMILFRPQINRLQWLSTEYCSICTIASGFGPRGLNRHPPK